MCGIAGIYQKDNKPIDIFKLQQISTAMQNRGPDAAGLWVAEEKNVGLAHRRLAIIDLSQSANQPMEILNRFLIIFNGMIYNYQQLRARLIKKGVLFQTHSDTEIIVQLYALYGEACLMQLRGMFAFAIFDKEKKTLFIARDPFGMKPLYYIEQGDTFYFASQVKPLAETVLSQKIKDPAGQVGFFLLGYVPEPFTIYEKIKALSAGHYAIISQKNFSIRSYCSVADFMNVSFDSEKKETFIRNALQESIFCHLIADVPCGLFLSAGLDSMILTLLAQQKQSSLQAFTLGFEQFKNTPKDEVPGAIAAAKRFQIPHQVFWLKEAEICEQLEIIEDVMDQPSIDGINIFLISQKVAQQGIKVVLTGIGADELFGGYPSFKQIPKFMQLSWLGFFPTLQLLLNNVVAKLFKHKFPNKYAQIFNFTHCVEAAYFLKRAIRLPYELEAILDPALAKAGLEKLNIMQRLQLTANTVQSKKHKISLLETAWYMRNQLLRDADWASMANAIELRLPFVDSVLWQKVSPLLTKTSETKAKIFAKTFPELSSPILKRKKTGFYIPYIHNKDVICEKKY